MTAVSISLSTLVDRAQLDLVGAGGQGLRVVLSSELDTDDTTFTLSDATSVSVTDVIEFGDELVLVTDKSADAVPVFTCARAYFNTTAATHASGDVGHVNPTYPRRKIAEGVRRAFARMDALGVVLVKSVTKSRIPDLAYCEMPTDCRDVLQVLYWADAGNGKVYELLKGWKFYDNMPTAKFSTGKALNLPILLEDEDEVEVQYRAAYRWSSYPDDPAADDTIDVPEGAEDLPALYAAAWLVSGREISRTEIDKAEEWTQSATFAQGQTGALVRARWQEFYRALDEARRLNQVPTPILVRPRSRL